MKTLGQFALVILLTAAVLSGCAPRQYAEQADKAAYGMLASGERSALVHSGPFEVTYKPFSPEGDQRDGPIRVGNKLIVIGGDEPVILTLEECLEIAFRNSRQFQDRKEGLYASALDLANTRRSWDIPLFGADLTAEASHTRINDTSETKEASAEFTPSITQRFAHGGILTLAATVDWMTDFIFGSESNIVGSMVEANFTQPLLRGAWRGLAYEDQYRLTRDFLFEVFEYERSRQTFAADIFTRYYGVLRQRDQLENERISIQRQEATLAVTRVQVEGGLLTKVDEDRAEQALLNAQVRFERNQQGYRNALDAYKILVGLPVQSSVELDYPNALDQLVKVGPKPVDLREPEAVAIALSTRPDVLTERARVRDADRDVEIAADDFLPQLNVELGISAEGTPPRKFHRIRFNRHTRFAAVTFNYEFDQTDNRDAYRLAIIDYEKAQRDLERFVDQVRLDVRGAYRELMQSKRSYELQLRNVRIATRRHKLAQLEQKEGRLSPTDVLDAEEDLRSARNGLTSALVSYTTTRLQFLATLGMIEVDERGVLYERTKPSTFERIARGYEYIGGE